jgi:lipoprotein signal peptidase
MEIEVLLAIIVIPICILIWYYIRTKNQERMRLIEKGINPDEGLNVTEYRKQTYVKNGVFFITLGVGLLIGHINVINHQTVSSFITYATSLLIFGGIAFLINYRIIKRWNRK